MRMNERLGDICYVNGKDAFSEFGADLFEHEQVAGKIKYEMRKTIGNNSINVLSRSVELGGIKLSFYVHGSDKDDCKKNTSRLIAEFLKCVVKVGAGNFEYDSVLSSYDVVETGIDEYEELTVSLDSVKRLPLESKKVTNGVPFTNIGTVESGMRIKVSSASSLQNVKVAGITIKNLEPNEEFIIDGIEGKVTSNGVNKYAETDMIEFPKVKPGENVVSISGGSVNVTVEFYPVFIM